MADEPKGNDPMRDFWFIVLLLVGLTVLWYANGGPGRADLRGIFISPLPPVGSGQVYGPPGSPAPDDSSGSSGQNY